MRLIAIVVLSLLCLSKKVEAQTPSVTLGPDVIIPACSTSTTLHATVVSGLQGSATYTVQNIPYNPYPFNAGTTVLTAGNFSQPDDYWSNTQYPLPFPFCFFNTAYNNFSISLNGKIGFNANQVLTYDPWSLNGVTFPNTNPSMVNTIMGAYYDIYPFTFSAPATSNINFATYGTAPYRAFVVSFNTNPMFSCTSNLGTQQIVLYETTNVIEINIQSKPNCVGWNSNLAVEGIMNNPGTVFIPVPGRGNTAWTATNDSWRFIPSGASLSWYVLGNPTPIATGVDSLVVSPTVTTDYVVQADFSMCGGGGSVSLYDTIKVIKQPPVQVSTSIVEPLCFGGTDGSITAQASGGSGTYTYSNNGGSNSSSSTFNGLTAGSYTIQATDAYGCTGTSVVTLTQPSDILFNVVSTYDVLCKYQNTGSVHLAASGGTPGYMFWYDNSNQQNSPNFDTLFAGMHTFNVVDAHGCTKSLQQEVFEPDSLLTVSLESQEATCINRQDGSITASPSGGIPGYDFEWTNMDNHLVNFSNSPTINNLPTGVYHVVVKDANDCISATQIQVEQQLCCQLFLPNAFTPNADGKNDYFKIVQYGAGVKLGEFRVYNRWGQEMFSTRDVTQGWNGSYKGTLQDANTYSYIVEYQCNDRGVISQKIAKGDFILLR